MFKSFKNWWNRNDIRFAELQSQITAVSQSKQAVEEQNEELNKELEIVRAEKAADEARKNGTEPWVEIRSAEFDTTRGVQIDLDWNTAFIKYLKENGIKGKTEEIIIQKWLAFLYEDLVNKIEEDTTEESIATTTTPNEFE